MSGMPSDDASAEVRLEGEVSGEKVEETQAEDQNEGSGMPSPQEEEAAIRKKYGGKMPKKSPLISKDHERAFFDSADWALGKQGGSPTSLKGPSKLFDQNSSLLNKMLVPADLPMHLQTMMSLSLPAEELIQNDDPTEDKNKE